jgi:CBS domain-containing protein
MRLLLQESLAYRARLRSVREVLTGRTGRFDIKSHALLPIVNIARWAALSAGSPALPTVERIRSAAGPAILPEERADTLVEVFEVLQRLRLRYQLSAYRNGASPSDVLVLEHLSAIDRAVISQAVREIALVQRRMANVSAFVPPAEWSSPAPSR